MEILKSDKIDFKAKAKDKERQYIRSKDQFKKKILHLSTYMHPICVLVCSVM